MRSFSAIAVLAVAAIALPACGSNDKLNESQADALTKRAQSFDKEATSIKKKIDGCTKLAQAGQQAEFQNCLSDALKNFEADLGSLGSYVEGVSADVEGECRTRLLDWVESLDEAGDGFGKAAREARAGDLEQVQSVLEDIDYQELAEVGKKAAKACSE